MTKAELIQAVREKAGDGVMTRRMAAGAVDALFATVSRTLKKEGRFSYPGFGSLTVKNRKARKGLNPRTREVMTIKASKTVRFRPGKELKSSL